MIGQAHVAWVTWLGLFHSTALFNSLLNITCNCKAWREIGLERG